MAETEWGLKRLCPSCGARYYDFDKRPVICPACGTELDIDGLMVGRRKTAASVPVATDTVDETKPTPTTKTADAKEAPAIPVVADLEIDDDDTAVDDDVLETDDIDLESLEDDDTVAVVEDDTILEEDDDDDEIPVGDFSDDSEEET